MPEAPVSVAIPVRDGGAPLRGVLESRAPPSVAHELIVCDTGSRDGSAQLAREHGARVIEIAPGEFGHGRTRNMLMRESSGAHVAFLSQDAEPADERWLEGLLGGFELDAQVALVYGPYVARPQAPARVHSELRRWFGSLAPAGEPVVERLQPGEREHARELLVGRRGFFSDANACVAKRAWELVPFREIDYAEDRALALDMLIAGYAKAYVPAAGVLHSHSYSPAQQLRRSFDEGRALREVYGWREAAGPRHALRRLRGELGAAAREQRVERPGGLAAAVTLAAVTCDQMIRIVGSQLGGRSEMLPQRLRRQLSLERRDGAPAERGR